MLFRTTPLVLSKAHLHLMAAMVFATQDDGVRSSTATVPNLYRAASTLLV